MNFLYVPTTILKIKNKEEIKFNGCEFMYCLDTKQYVLFNFNSNKALAAIHQDYIEYIYTTYETLEKPEE